MTDELSAISVGLSVGLGSLDRDIAAIEKKVGRVEGDHLINFKVGKVDTAAVQEQLRRLTSSALPVPLKVTVARGSAAVLRRELIAQLGVVPIQIKANLSATEVARIRREIISRLGTIPIAVRTTGGGGGGAGGTSAPLTTHERRVNDDLAAKTGRAVRGTSAQPAVARAAPAGPSPASSPTATVPAAQRPSTRRATEKAHEAIETAVRQAGPTPAVSVAQQRAAERPMKPTPLGRAIGKTGQEADFGGIPTGEAVSVTRRYDAKGNLIGAPMPKATTRTARYLRKRTEAGAGRRVSSDELTRQKTRVDAPETESEIEYASRPTQAFVQPDEQTVFEAEKRGHGVRGARRSGARERNEPVLTDLDRLSTENQRTANEFENAPRREAEVRAPARRSAAYYGSAGGRLHGSLAKLQFYKIDPAFGEAFGHLQNDDMAAARASLRGASQRLAGADPRDRRKFFKMFRNIENVPPELLEKDAALRALFAEIHSRIDPSFTNIKSAATMAGAGAGGPKVAKGPARNTVDKDLASLNAGTMTREEFEVRHPHLKRETGGHVEGRQHASHPARFNRATMLGSRAYQRTLRRWEASSALQRQGFGPDTDERLDSDRLAYQADNLFERLKNESRKAWTGEHREGGGHVEGPLQRRIRMARDVYIVGEKKPELYEGQSGRLEIVGEKGPEVRSFPEPGKIHPYVPEWVRRGMAKDLTHREPGGPVRGFGGRAFRSFVPGEKEAIASGILTRAGSAAVQRVFVVNLPALGQGLMSAPMGAGFAAGPMRFGSEKDATRFADRLGGQIGSALKDLLDATKEVRPEPAEKESPVRATALEKFEARLESRRSVAGLRERLTTARSTGAEQASLLPSRGLPVFGAQLAQQLIGGRAGAQARTRTAQAATELAAKAVSDYTAQNDKLRVALAARDRAETGPTRVKATEIAREQLIITREAREEAERAVKVAEVANQSIIRAPGILKNIGAATLGTIAGVTLYGAAIGAAQAGITAIGQVVGPVIERMTGYQNVTAGVTSALADQTRQQDGAVKTAVALATAQAGLSKNAAATISPLLEQRAATEAGNKALQESIDLLHSSEAIRRQNAGRGVDRGVTQTTGGLFGSIINGIPSTSEQIGNALRDVPAVGAEDRRAVLQRGQQSVLGGRDPSKLVGIELQLYASLTAELETLGGVIDESPGRIRFFNDAIQKGGEKFRFVAQSELPKLTDAIRNQAAQAAYDANAIDIGNNIRDKKTILVDSLGRIVTNADDVSKALQAVNVGLTTPDPALLIKQLTERIIPAQRSAFRAEGQFQRNLSIPGQFALNQLANPTPGLRGGPGFDVGLVGQGDRAAQQAADSYRAQVGDAVSFVNAEIEKGHEALLDLVPADLRQEFSGILDDITKTGQQISSIQLGVQQRQVNLAVHEYNNQLRIARRSLQDAKDLQAGIAGETRNTVGGLEGQNIRLSRQLTLLQFALQQRSITTDLAVAKFQAPGDTPEERFARQEEAVVKARIAQQQLDLSKRIASNQFTSLTLPGTGEVARQITDLNAQIDLLEEGRSVTIDTAAAQRALDILTKKQEYLVQQAGTYLEEGGKIVQAAIQAATEVQRQTGKGFEYILSQTANAWGIFGDQAEAVLDGLTGSAPTSYRTPEQQREFDKAHHARGIIGTTAGRTDMTVGEAGAEKVAILRNPHLVPMQALAPVNEGPWGGGGAAPVTLIVQINNPVIREDNDISELVAEVERVISTKLQLLGVRSPSY